MGEWRVMNIAIYCSCDVNQNSINVFLYCFL